MTELLEERTKYFRSDNPDGVEFAAGTEAPDPAEGWVTDPKDIREQAPREFECTTLGSYEELLRSERAGAARLREQVSDLTRQYTVLSKKHSDLVALYFRLTSKDE
jgi:hypothetical protein